MMETAFNLKKEIVFQLCEKLKSGIDELSQNIKLARESRDNETKSSVGDKYETGREMMNMELKKINVQLAKTLALQNELKKINLQKEFNSVGFGSIVFTNKINYFISFGLGKIEIGNSSFFVFIYVGKDVLNQIFLKHRVTQRNIHRDAQSINN